MHPKKDVPKRSQLFGHGKHQPCCSKCIIYQQLQPIWDTYYYE